MILAHRNRHGKNLKISCQTEKRASCILTKINNNDRTSRLNSNYTFVPMLDPNMAHEFENILNYITTAIT